MILGKVDFKTKSIARDKEEHFIMIEGSSLRKTKIINVYIFNKISKYMNQIIDRNKGRTRQIHTHNWKF